MSQESFKFSSLFRFVLQNEFLISFENVQFGTCLKINYLWLKVPIQLSVKISSFYENLFESIFICDNLWEIFFCACVIISESLFKPFLFVKISFYLCSSVRISFIKYILKTSVLKSISWGSNFEVCSCSEIHFLRQQLFFDLWLLISMAAALCFHGCWLVWVLLYVFLTKSSLQAIFFQFWHV